jgi:hypothetical protein
MKSQSRHHSREPTIAPMPTLLQTSRRDASQWEMLGGHAAPTRRLRPWRVVRGGLVVFLTGCSQDCETTNLRYDERQATLTTVAPDRVTAPVSATVPLAATVNVVSANPTEPCLGGNVLVGWESRNTTIAVVENVRAQHADITAIAPGTTTIVARAGGLSARSNPQAFVEFIEDSDVINAGEEDGTPTPMHSTSSSFNDW